MIKKSTLALITISAGLLINSTAKAAANNDSSPENLNNLPTEPVSLTAIPSSPETESSASKNSDGSLNKEAANNQIEEQGTEKIGNAEGYNKPSNPTGEKSNDNLNNSIAEKLKALTKNSGKKKSNDTEPNKESNPK